MKAKLLLFVQMLVMFLNLCAAPLRLKNQSGHHIRFGIRYTYNDGTNWAIEKEIIWLKPQEEKSFDLGDLSLRLQSIDVAFTQEPKIIKTLKEERIARPIVTSPTVRFKIPSKKYDTILRSAAFAPPIIVTADTANNKPILNIPEDVQALEKAIQKAIEEDEKAKREHLSKIKKEVHEILPTIPSGETGEGGIIGIIGDYSSE